MQFTVYSMHTGFGLGKKRNWVGVAIAKLENVIQKTPVSLGRQ